MMTETRALIAKARAEIAAADGEQSRAISTNLLNTIEALLTACCNQRDVDQGQVADLETTVRALSTAVLAITDSVSASAPAILSLHDQVDKAP